MPSDRASRELSPPDRQLSDDELTAEWARGRIAAVAAFVSSLLLIAALVVRMSELTSKTRLNAAETLLHLHAHSDYFILFTVLFALGSAFTAPVLIHIGLAARSRRPSLQSLVVMLPIVGPLIVALSYPLYTLLRIDVANDFAKGADQSVKHATDVVGTTALSTATGLLLAGTIALAFAFIVISLQGGRVGLITRFLSIIGIVIGIGTVLAPNIGIVLEAFWLASIGTMLMMPDDRRLPAWPEGRVIPTTPARTQAADPDPDPTGSIDPAPEPVPTDPTDQSGPSDPSD